MKFERWHVITHLMCEYIEVGLLGVLDFGPYSIGAYSGDSSTN